MAIYTHYKSDYNGAYDTILGCIVHTLDDIPEGMVGESFEGGTYEKFVAKGDLSQGVVYKTWVAIWNSPLRRSYTADFEVYGEKSQDPTNAAIDIFVAVREY